jgi:formate transporter
MTTHKTREPIPVDTDVDILPPDKIAPKAADAGVDKGTMATSRLVVLGLLAGAYIGLGGLFATVAGAGATATMSYGAGQVLMGIAFSLGLVLVLVAGAELFTGNVLLLVAVAEKRLSWGHLGRAWSIVYVANLVGSIALALLVLAAGLHAHGGGAVAKKAIEIAGAKTALPFGVALASGVIANALVCLTVWLAYGARTTGDKIIAVMLPICAFVAVGAEHSVANMYLVPYGLLLSWITDLAGNGVSMPASLGIAGFLANLLATTIGNIIGGGIVGFAYWFAYLRRA